MEFLVWLFPITVPVIFGFFLLLSPTPMFAILETKTLFCSRKSFYCDDVEPMLLSNFLLFSFEYTEILLL